MKTIRILDISSYIRIPPSSGGAKRILLPFMHMKETDGIEVCLLFHSESPEFTKKAVDFLENAPAIIRVEGVTRKYSMTESICKPDNICQDVWNVIDKPLLDKAIEMVHQISYDIIQIEHSQMAWMVPKLKQESPHSKIVLDLHNVEYLLYERWQKYETESYEEHARLHHLYELMRSWEEKTWPWFDAAISVSPVESMIFQSVTNNPSVWDVATGGGVDLATYHSDKQQPKDIDLLYIGTMEWYPNAHGMKWFIEEVLPLVRLKHPNVTLYIAGFGKPDLKLRKLAEADNHIYFLGEVADDVSLFRRSKVFLVPLFIGAGARVKIPTALACELPIVSTTIGAEGLTYENDKEILIRDDARSFADAICSLLEDDDLRDMIGKNARKLTEKKYSVQKCVQELVKIYSQIVNNTNNTESYKKRIF